MANIEQDLGEVNIEFLIDTINKIVALYDQGNDYLCNYITRDFDSFEAFWGYHEWTDDYGDPCCGYELSERFRVVAPKWKINLVYKKYEERMAAIAERRERESEPAAIMPPDEVDWTN